MDICISRTFIHYHSRPHIHNIGYLFNFVSPSAYTTVIPGSNRFSIETEGFFRKIVKDFNNIHSNV